MHLLLHVYGNTSCTYTSEFRVQNTCIYKCIPIPGACPTIFRRGWANIWVLFLFNIYLGGGEWGRAPKMSENVPFCKINYFLKLFIFWGEAPWIRFWVHTCICKYTHTSHTQYTRTPSIIVSCFPNHGHNHVSFRSIDNIPKA